MRMLATAATAALLMARGALAASVTFSGSSPIVLTGPGEVQWQVQNDGGTDDGTPNGTCSAAGGLTVEDAQFSAARQDAFDSGLTVWIDDVIFVSPDAVDVTDNTLTSGPVTLSGLEVTVEYKAMQDSPTLRTRVIVHNPTAAKIASDLRIMTPFGSDPSTISIDANSNSAMAAVFVISADDPMTPSDAVNTLIHGGPNNPHGNGFSPISGFNPSDTTADCAGTQGVNLVQGIRIPPGGTSEYLFFSQVHGTIASAQSDEHDFDTTPALNSPLLAGMSAASLIRTLNWSFVPIPALVGGGPGAGTQWSISNGTGTDEGGRMGQCDWAPGLGIGDATLDPGGGGHLDQGDALDDGHVLFVNGQQLVAGLQSTFTSNQYTSEQASVGGLTTQAQFTALPGSPTLRTLFTFANPTTAPVTATIKSSSNFGSDSGTGYRATSSGDTTVTVADRWTVSSDNPTTPSDPVNLLVFAGPSAPVPPSALDPTAIECSDPDGVTATFEMTVPAGETRALLFFNEIYATNEQGVAAGPAYDTTPARTSALLEGLDAPTLASVVNWAFCAGDVSLCDDSNACTDDACGSAGGCTHTPIPRAASVLSAGCRLAALDDGVQAASGLSDKLRAGLVAKLAAARDAAGQAGGQTGKARKRLVAKAIRALHGFSAKLKAKAVKKAVDKATLDGFKAAVKDLTTDLRQIAKS